MGDPVYINRFLHSMIGEFMEAPEDMARAEGILQHRAKVLLGMTDEAIPLRKWNAPGGIDTHVASVLSIDETDPVLRVAGGLLRLLSGALDIAAAIDEGALPEQWQPGFDAMIEEYTRIFLGLPVEESDD